MSTPERSNQSNHVHAPAYFDVHSFAVLADNVDDRPVRATQRTKRQLNERRFRTCRGHVSFDYGQFLASAAPAVLKPFDPLPEALGIETRCTGRRPHPIHSRDTTCLFPKSLGYASPFPPLVSPLFDPLLQPLQLR